MSSTVASPKLVIRQRHGNRSKPHPYEEAKARIERGSSRRRKAAALRQLDISNWERGYYNVGRLDTLADLIDWIDHVAKSLHPRNAADSLFGVSDGCTPIADRAHELASELAVRLMLPGKPRRTAEPLNVKQVEVELDGLRIWALDHCCRILKASSTLRPRKKSAKTANR